MTHTCTKHEPGTRACYNACLCRCEPCRQAAAQYVKRRTHAATQGRTYLVASDRVLEHIAALRASGMTFAGIAAASGVPHSTIESLHRKGRTRITRATAARLLGVRPFECDDTGKVDACGVRRRLRALHALGWTFTQIGAHIGVNPKIVQRWAHQGVVASASRKRVVAAYDAMWQQAPPASGGASRARHAATRKGWALPMQWDDGYGPHGIDNPDATPVGARGNGRQSARSTDVVELAELGTPAHEIGVRLGMSIRSVERALFRAGRGELWAACRPRSLDQRTERAA